MLEIRDLTVQYGDNVILNHFNLSMKDGEIISLVGESGSGKTTVIRAIPGLLPGNGMVTAGEILFEGQSLTEKTDQEMQMFRGSQISMIFQDAGAMMNPTRRIGSQYVEYLRHHDRSLSKSQAMELAIKMLEQTRLPDGANIMRSYPFQLSGGMRQRVGIAMAMSFHPKLLLADEPTSALDVTTQAQIVRQMMSMQKQYNTGIILVTHNLGVAAYMSDRLLVMKEGKIVEEGTRDEILNHSSNDYTKKLINAIPDMDGELYVG